MPGADEVLDYSTRGLSWDGGVSHINLIAAEGEGALVISHDDLGSACGNSKRAGRIRSIGRVVNPEHIGAELVLDLEP